MPDILSSLSSSQFGGRCQSGGLGLFFSQPCADSGKWLKVEITWQQICVDIIKLSSRTGFKALNCLLTQLFVAVRLSTLQMSQISEQLLPPPNPSALLLLFYSGCSLCVMTSGKIRSRWEGLSVLFIQVKVQLTLLLSCLSHFSTLCWVISTLKHKIWKKSLQIFLRCCSVAP